MTDKKCSHCKLFHPLENFSRNRTKYDGYQAYCKQCVSARSAKTNTASNAIQRHRLALTITRLEARIIELENELAGYQ